MVDRGVLLLRYKEPAVLWINEADPSPRDKPLELSDVNEERTAYLIADAAGDSPATLHRWLKRNYATLFEMELEGWYTIPSLWPQNRTFKLFMEWFEPECHTVVIDLVGGEIVEDEEDES
jgi:hypothetical protein